MLVTRRSMISGIERTRDLDVTPEHMAIWDAPNRPLVQDLFPNLTPEEREFIMTGITQEEWDEHIVMDEDDE